MTDVDNNNERQRPITLRCRCTNAECETGVEVVEVPRTGMVLSVPARLVCVRCMGEMKVLNKKLERGLRGLGAEDGSDNG